MAKRVNANIFIKESSQGVIMDVRTPAEFETGHIVGAVNLPLFTNEQRAIVGTIYKKKGREEAVQKGLEFVGPRLAEIVSTAKLLSRGKPIYMYCWRGGMRSGSVAWLLETAGLEVTLLAGGYKGYRRHFEQLLDGNSWQFALLTGMTGCGKTKLLEILAQRGEQVLDLEGLANHRGSAFGGIGQGEQPSTEHFINLLHNAFCGFTPQRYIWCESESMRIGKVYIPEMLFKRLGRDIVIQVAMEREQRLDIIMEEYGELPPEKLSKSFRQIAKRMGPEKMKEAVELVDEGEIRAAASMGLDYYDKTYARNYAEQENIVKLTVDADNLERDVDELIKIKDKLIEI